MSDERSFERFVADHVAGAAGSTRMPDDFYDDIHAVASRTRQRPEWLALIKEPPMRFESTLGVGSPIARVTAIAAATLLLALLSAGALVAGAQSPSPTLPEAQAPSFFTGSAPDDACQLAEPTTEVVDGVIRERGGSGAAGSGRPTIPGSPGSPRSSGTWMRSCSRGAGGPRSSPPENGSRTRPGRGRAP